VALPFGVGDFQRPVMPRLNALDRLGRMKVVLAVRNLQRSGGRLWVSLFGIVFATFLMGVQGSLLYSFTLAASRIVDAVDADLMIVGKGTPTFDYVTPIPERYVFLALGEDGVTDGGRGIAGWAPIERPNGDKTLVLVVGVEDAFRGRLPDVLKLGAAEGLSESALVIDATDAQVLQFSDGLPAVQIAARRGQFITTVDGFSSFLGSPYIFAEYTDARQFLRLERTQVSFLVLRIAPGYGLDSIRDSLRVRLPDVDVWTRSEFSTKSRLFWLVQTGAGGALTLAAILGFCIGLVLVAQTIYSITAENIEEYATLKAMGASNADVRAVVLVQSLVCGVVGGVIGLILVAPFAALIRPVITWITVPVWIYVMVAVALFMLCVLASLIAARPAVSIDPGRVFRA
jgi:putative ABC transport system permease protein